jgi:hypothetical protein
MSDNKENNTINEQILFFEFNDDFFKCNKSLCHEKEYYIKIFHDKVFQKNTEDVTFAFTHINHKIIEDYAKSIYNINNYNVKNNNIENNGIESNNIENNDMAINRNLIEKYINSMEDMDIHEIDDIFNILGSNTTNVEHTKFLYTLFITIIYQYTKDNKHYNKYYDVLCTLIIKKMFLYHVCDAIYTSDNYEFYEFMYTMLSYMGSMDFEYFNSEYHDPYFLRKVINNLIVCLFISYYMINNEQNDKQDDKQDDKIERDIYYFLNLVYNTYNINISDKITIGHQMLDGDNDNDDNDVGSKMKIDEVDTIDKKSESYNNDTIDIDDYDNKNIIIKINNTDIIDINNTPINIIQKFTNDMINKLIIIIEPEKLKEGIDEYKKILNDVILFLNTIKYYFNDYIYKSMIILRCNISGAKRHDMFQTNFYQVTQIMKNAQIHLKFVIWNLYIIYGNNVNNIDRINILKAIYKQQPQRFLLINTNDGYTSHLNYENNSQYYYIIKHLIIFFTDVVTMLDNYKFDKKMSIETIQNNYNNVRNYLNSLTSNSINTVIFKQNKILEISNLKKNIK